MVYHESGKHIPTKYLDALEAAIMSQEWATANFPDDLSIVTFSNYKEATILERTSAKLGIPVKVYGRSIADWGIKKNINKLLLSYQACCEEKTTYIMGLDSRDVVILAPPASILEAFKRSGLKMLIGAEPKFALSEIVEGQLRDMFDKLPGAANTSIRYLNSGQWIAEREFAKDLYRKAIDLNLGITGHRADQTSLAYTLLQNPQLHECVKLDYDCRIFQVRFHCLPDNYLSVNQMHVPILSDRRRKKLLRNLSWRLRLNLKVKRFNKRRRVAVAAGLLFLQTNTPRLHRTLKFLAPRANGARPKNT